MSKEIQKLEILSSNKLTSLKMKIQEQLLSDMKQETNKEIFYHNKQKF